MKLLELTLTNIGPFKNQTIKFDTNSKQNIILLCGENGAGKTTIQKAIKLALFGSYLYGLKQTSKNNEYITDVTSMIRNKASYGEIEIKFIVIQDYVEKEYTIYRRWSIEEKFGEYIELYINNTKIEGTKMVNAIEYINHYYTPKLIDCIMFDGEKVISFIEQNTISDYLKDSVHHLFNLNYYLNLINDINKYLDRDLKKDTLTFEQVELNDTEKSLRLMNNQLSILEEKKKSILMLIQNNDFSIEQKINEYSNITGISPNEIEELKSNIHKLEQKQEGHKIDLKTFIEDDLIFVLNSNLIKNTIDQIENEKPKLFKQQIDDMINSSVFTEDQIQQLTNIYNDLENVNVQSYINLSNQEGILFKNYYKNIEQHKESYANLIEQEEVNNYLIKKMKNIAVSVNSDEAITILQQIEDYIQLVEDYKKQLANVNESIEKVNKQIVEYSNKQVELKKIVYEQSKSNNSYVMSKKYRDICQKFYNSEINDLIEEISSQSLSLLLKTYRKKNFITDLKLTRNFDIQLYSKQEQKSLTQLSAGEKQILIACIMVTIIKLSGRNIPLLFDTPAGRLDNIHMLNFYQEIMMKSQNQVIIMPTSKEINNEVIKCIHDQVKSCYTIKYNEEGYSEIRKNVIFDKEW